jgi:sulfhydrogenase subunit beta (sulfur reductase)
MISLKKSDRHDPETFVIEHQHFDSLLTTLKQRGYRVVGPTAQEGALVYDELTSADDLPSGCTDEQAPGRYRLKKSDGRALFGFTLGAQSWKRFLHPPTVKLLEGKRDGDTFEIKEEKTAQVPYAFIGVRPCELHAIGILDRVFLNSNYVDPTYAACRNDTFVVAVNCTQAGGTCFCASMNTGPRATAGFDLALTEFVDPNRHFFVVEVGSERGAEILRDLPHEQAGESEKARVERGVAQTIAQMGRTMDTQNIKELLYKNYDHPRWNDVADRCLSCANCTMVCPTCFCATVEDITDLAGDHSERWRKWDSCFAMDFTYIHGGSIRATTRSRYRQWLVHKLGTWIDQFGTTGCVGCGRCITWCPVGIDITEEVKAIRETKRSPTTSIEDTNNGDS